MSTQSLYHETELAAHGVRPSLGHGLLARFAAWRRRQQELKEIACITEHELADIGLTRSDLPAIAAGEFQRDDLAPARGR